MTDITALIMSESEIWQDSQSKIGIRSFRSP